MSVDVRPGAYGIEGVGRIGRGRIAIVYASEGPRLALHFLRADPIQPRVPEPDLPPLPDDPPEAADRPRHDALWVWNTAELVRDAEERGHFLDFIEATGIGRVFLYLSSPPGERPSRGFLPFASDEIGPLVADLRARGALTYGLDGDPEYVREENRAGILRTVARVVEHNRSVPEAQRLHGIRYDIEPYLLPDFHGPARAGVLERYVSVLADAAEVARAGGLAFGVDIPFWLDTTDEETGALFEVESDRGRSSVLEALMKVADDIAVMDYRTQASGVNGVVAQAATELRLGAELGVDVFVGVETGALLDEDLHTFWGPPSEGLPTRSDARWVVLDESADGSARLWLVDGPGALSALAEETIASRLLLHWPAGRPIRVGADMLSFHGLGAARMRAMTDEATPVLERSAAFAGYAYHDYVALRRLLSETAR